MNSINLLNLLSMFGRTANRLMIFFIVLLGFVAPVLADMIDFAAGWKLYQQGRFASAFDVWQPLAEAGDAQAQFNLAVLYEQGRGVEIDSEKAAYWNDRAVASGYAPALHNLALSLLAEKKNIEAISYLKQAAAVNFAASQYTLGKIHQFGIGIPENPIIAFQYVKLAANSGLVTAQYNLGKMYRDGYGVDVDEIISTKWFEAAASQGYGKAQNNISGRYRMGQGVIRDDVQALKWAILAAKGGIVGAIQKEEFFRARMAPERIREAEIQAENFSAKQ